MIQVWNVGRICADMLIHHSRFLILADGMGEPGMSWQSALAIFAVIVALISGIARLLGASRWLAFLIPLAPLLFCLILSLFTGAMAAGQGGAVPWCLFFGPLVLLALPVSAITVFIVPKRRGKPSA
jgi:hypothetical protein